MANSRGPLPKTTAEQKFMRGYGPKPGSSNASSASASRLTRVPPAPEGLGPKGKKLWKTLYRELADADMLATTDLASFELMIRAYDAAQQAYGELATTGVVIEGYKEASRKAPAMQAARDFTALYIRLAAQFGLTPASAARLGLEVVDDGD